MTRASTGLSGITSSSPALSVAARAGATVVTVYEDGKYVLHLLNGDARGLAPDPGPAIAAVLPPVNRRPSAVTAAIADATTGLPPSADDFETTDYKPSLSLEQVGQPTIAVGASRFGAVIGGGIAFQFGDVLGDHTLITAVQLNGGLSSNFSARNTAAQALYLNTAHRWNWGIVGGQTPYLSGGTLSGIATLQGTPVEVDQSILYRQTERSAAGVIAYPFSRAQRIEWQAGVSRITFDQIIRTTAFSLITGQVLQDDTSTTSIGDALSLATTSTALVYDTASFGATSPVQGQRYRFEASPTFGSINFTGLLADYRRYFMPAPFYTIAGRVLHYGRYGSGGQDPRLSPLYLGYPDLVRGYDVGPVGATSCAVGALTVADCTSFDQLMGSRMLVGNLELRFPLLRPFGVSQRMYGPLPVEVAFFTDGGVAWNSGQRPSFFGGDRHGIASAGAALRVNLGGYAVAELDFARPVPTQGHGWVFQFNFSPGF